MAQRKDELKKAFPLPAYYYVVRIGTESYGFSQISGLSFEYEPITYRHGLSAIEGAHYMPGILQPINLSLERGIVRKGSLLLNWINNIHLESLVKQDLTIDLNDEEGTPQVSWRVQNAIPTMYEARDFSADSNEVAIESLSLIANNMRITYHDAEQSGGTRGSGFSF